MQRDTADAKTRRLIASGDLRQAAHAASPLSSGVETNASAKDWHLLSPDGTAYHFRNLALWIREHADLFDQDDVVERPQSKTGVTTRAQSALGKLRPERSEKRAGWKGWRWLSHRTDKDCDDV